MDRSSAWYAGRDRVELRVLRATLGFALTNAVGATPVSPGRFSTVPLRGGEGRAAARERFPLVAGSRHAAQQQLRLRGRRVLDARVVDGVQRVLERLRQRAQVLQRDVA